MPYITCEDASVGYHGKAVARHIDFQVNKGDYLYIVGENGAGKSTLVKTIVHLIKPLQGKIVEGDGLKPFEIGYLPQQSQIQREFPALVSEIVLSGTLLRKNKRPWYGKEEKKQAMENMKKMSVWELRNRSYRTLSGGQQQRVLLARAFCATSKLILLDEPVTGLDPKVTAEFYQLIKELNEKGTSVLMVSHDINAAMKYASHILHVGKKDSFFGTKEEYRESEIWKHFCFEGGMEGE